MNKLQLLNSYEVYDFDCCGEECIYVLTTCEQETFDQLIAAGFTEQQIKEALSDEGDLDLSILAFHYAGANWWSKSGGFVA